MPILNRELAEYFVDCLRVDRLTCIDADASLPLSFPLEDLQKIDFVIGHRGRLGPRAQRIRNSTECRWMQFVHELHEELGMFKGLEEHEKKHKREIKLCEEADVVVAVGSKVATTYELALRHQGKTVEVFTPEILEEFSGQAPLPTDKRRFGILVIGQGVSEFSELRGFDLAADSEAIGVMHWKK